MKNKKRIIGIYMIRNKTTGKIYIGQSINIKRRWRDHRYQLGENIHHSDHLQRSWNKYKKDNFDFIILEECSKSKLDDKEEQYISKYQSDDYRYGYNSNSGGSNSTVSDITIKKMKAANSTKPVLQFDIDGNFIKRWIGVNEAGRVLGINPTNISGCCNLRYGRKTALGSIWIHEDDYLANGLDLNNYLDKRPANSKSVTQIDLDGNIIANFPSAREASRQTGFNWRNISQVCNGDRKTHRGYKWVFT